MLNMRVLLVVSVTLCVLFSSINMVPSRSFLGEIKKRLKRQITADDEYCFDLFRPCLGFIDCILNWRDEVPKCIGTIKTKQNYIFVAYFVFNRYNIIELLILRLFDCCR